MRVKYILLRTATDLDGCFRGCGHSQHRGGAQVAQWCRRVGRRYVTIRPLTPWALGAPCPRGARIRRVPMFFSFDVSIPRCLRWLLSPHDPRLLRAAVWHDWARHRLRWSRKAAGALWYEILFEQGLRGFALEALWLAVSLYRWRKYDDMEGRS